MLYIAKKANPYMNLDINSKIYSLYVNVKDSKYKQSHIEYDIIEIKRNFPDAVYQYFFITHTQNMNNKIIVIIYNIKYIDIFMINLYYYIYNYF